MKIRFYLYVSYDADDTPNDGDIERFVAEKAPGAERCGSGFGLGVRDIEFRLEKPLDQAGIDKVSRDLTNNFGIDFAVSQDAWPDDDENDDPQPIDEYGLQAQGAAA